MQLKHIRIGYRLAAGFAIMLLMMAGITAIAVLASRQTRASLNDTVSRTKAKSAHVADMRHSLFRQGLAARNIGMATDPAEMQKEMTKIAAGQKAYADAQARLAAAGLGDKEQALLAEMAQHERAVLPLMKQAEEFVAAFNARQAVQVLTTKAAPIQEKWLAAIDRLADLQTRQIEDNLAAFDADSNRANAIMVGIAAVSMLLAVGVAMFLSRSIVLPLQQAVNVARRVAAGELDVDVGRTARDETGQLLAALQEMARSLTAIVDNVRRGTEAIDVASREITSGNADLSARTEGQASALEQTSASIAELTNIVRRNADHAQEANRLTAAASEHAVAGGRVVGHVVETMSSIRDSSHRIVDITGVIDGIAFQTNILALNAAVEAARAGEQGRGFAVVASEVRGLAQRAAAAAKEIKALIDDSVDKVNAGDRLVEQARESMQQIVASIGHVAGIMSEISAASQAQSNGIGEVNRAIAAMDDMTQQNAALVEESAAAAQSMQQQTQALVQAVSVFHMAPAQSPMLLLK